MPAKAAVKPAKSVKNASAAPATADVEKLRSLIKHHLVSTLARPESGATPHDWWVATALAVRDTIHERMIATQAIHNEQNVRRVYYFSLEYLMGRLFGNNLLATGLLDDAQATLDLPALGYGIYYEFGLFRQQFVNGFQVEHPDNWMMFGNPWEVVRREYTQEVRFFGRVENVFDDRGNY